MSDWDDLPNGAHIDRILDHAARYPHKWEAAWKPHAKELEEVLRAADRDAWATAVNKNTTPGTRSGKMRSMTAPRPRRYDRGPNQAIIALVAWDDCAYILDLHPDVVRTMAFSGNHPAALLYVAVMAMREEYADET